MNIWRLVLREVSHRRLNFLLGLFSDAAAVACLVGAMTLLRAHEIRTEQILSEKQSELETAVAAREKEVEQAGVEYEDSMRKITKGLGFNILILPADQDLGELHTQGTLSKSMPEEFVERLTNSNIVTINHLLPLVMHKMDWEEAGQTILLAGTRGEVPLLHRDEKKPLQEPVAAGTMVLGYQIARQKDWKEGGTVRLLGRDFTIAKIHAAQGTADDSTVWINLEEAQELLDRQNIVNAILALECNCAAKDRVAEIREEIAGILPGTQVIERGPPALARAEARNKAKQAADDSLAREKEAGVAAIAREEANRAALRAQREGFAAVLVPLVMAGAAVWIGFLAFGNVRQRSGEIGILRAIGLRSRQILSIFLGKAFLMGLAGAVIGYAAGFGVALAWGELPLTSGTSGGLFDPGLLALVFVIAPLLSAVASWIPAVLASRQDPAVILQEG